MTEGKSGRRSFRILESTLLKYEVITDSEYQQGLADWKVRHGIVSSIRSRVIDIDARFEALLYRAKNDTPGAIVIDVIELLNEKLDVVLEALPEFRESKEALVNQPAQICELSAEGMVFGANEVIQPETKLRLRFLLISDNRFFETFCRVVRITNDEQADQNRQSYSIAVEFQWTSAAEREVLIQHLFRKQSQTLRLRRKQLDNDDEILDLL